MDNQQLEKIDLYLRKELNSQEVKSFENDLDNKPELNSEFQFQKRVFEGLNQYRHAQLKARLDGIDVIGAQGGGLLSLGLSKVIVGVGVVVSISLGMWYFLSSPSNGNNKIYIAEINKPAKPNDYIWVWDIPESLILKSSNTKEIVVINEIKTKASTIGFDEKAKEIIKSFEVDLNKPQLMGMSVEDDFETEKVNNPKVETSDIAKISVNPIDVRVERSAGKLQYKYFDGKLFLYGDFTKEPYQILEINKKSGREIFLYFKESYYPIAMSNEVINLKPLYDLASHKQLDILRENKNN